MTRVPPQTAPAIEPCPVAIVGSGPYGLSLVAHDRPQRLSHRFESSVPGLFFVGPTLTGSFGSQQRFAAGAAYASTRVAVRLRRSLTRSLRPLAS